jgi:hypothetical protein
MSNEIISMRYYDDTIVNGLKDLINNLPSNIIMIEIGSYCGESTEIFLQSGKIKMIYCIDPWETDYDDNDDASKSNMKLAESIFDNKIINRFNQTVKIKLPSNIAKNLFDDASVDFVYIDGNHTYQYVKDDLINYLPKIKNGGFIGGHDFTNPNFPVKKAIIDYFGDTFDPLTFSDTSWLCEVKK